LSAEFESRGIPFQHEVELPVTYKGRLLHCTFKADFICFGLVIIELKALNDLTSREEAQILNYLKATRLSRGLLINFGSPRLAYKRFIHTFHLRPSASSVDNLSSAPSADGFSGA